MGTLFLVVQGSKVHRVGERLVVKKDNETVFESPIHHVTNVICYGNVQFATQTISLLLTKRVDVAFMSMDGQLQGKLLSFVPNTSGLKRVQLMSAEDAETGLNIAKILVFHKLSAMISLLKKRRNHSLKVDEHIIEKLHRNLISCKEACQLNQLRGIEGISTKIYFSAWDQLLPSGMKFERRTRIPAHNEVNALLNYFYTLLTNEVISIIEANSLSASIGHLHSYKLNRASLALDIIEPFRVAVVDKWLLQLIREKKSLHRILA